MNGVRDEVMAEGVHFDQWSHSCSVSKVIFVHTFGERWTRGGLTGANLGVHPSLQLLPQKGEGQPSEVGAATSAADNQVRRLPHLGQLLQGLLPDDGLVQEDVVQDGSQCVGRVLILGCNLDRLRDGNAEGPRAVLGVRPELYTSLCLVGRRAVHLGPECLHHQPPVGLGIIRGPNLPDLTLQAEQGGGIGQGSAPLPRTGLGGDPLLPCFRVVVGLWDRCVRLVGPRGGNPFVLVVDACRGAQQLLQSPGAEERRGPPAPVNLKDRLGNVNVALSADLLQNQVHGKQRGQIRGADGLVCAGVQWWGWRRGQVGDDVVPLCGHL
mmetsp:Transcript_65118/g.115890  ORF Transcript_65118/g.115890 Transcript_65118/m.115890 type:complete len:324 (+) Transcript_65118:601-1572(+)